MSTPTSTLATAVGLDPGEAQAIALAVELHAQAVLLDERRGRRAVIQHGLTAIGTLTVLEMAAERRLLDLKAALDALSRTAFHVTDELIQAALRRNAAREL